MNLKFERGQTLIEVLVALAAAVAVISAIAVTVVTSLANVEFTKNQNLATAYSREGLETVTKLARANWSSFFSLTAVYYCLSKGSSILTAMGANGCGQNIGENNERLIFVRQINIEQNSAACSNNSKVTSIVSWSSSKCSTASVFCHEVRLDSCLANTNPIQAP